MIDLHPNNWGLDITESGELKLGSFKLTDIASAFGTPLHVLNETRLIKTAMEFNKTMENVYPGKANVHYAFKCNSVPEIVSLLKQAKLKAEVMTEYELELAKNIGYTSSEIIVNGPCKTEQFIKQCLEEGVKYLVVDSLEELESINRLAFSLDSKVDILLRVNPDYIPAGMNRGTATGSRKGCAFGLDLKTGEVNEALHRLKKIDTLNFHGFHFHIGTGIRDPRDYSKVLKKLYPLFHKTIEEGFEINVIDVGGGFASMTTRELTTAEMFYYQVFNHLPPVRISSINNSFSDFGKEITKGLLGFFYEKDLPELILEPGRCIASPNQLLLLTVHLTKHRSGTSKWLITDGGLGTVTMPTYYEFHDIFLCNDVFRRKAELATIIGPCCFAADIVYKNKKMPKIHPGEILAIMDSGAYFTALESSFGFPRPAIVAVNDNSYRLIRKRETFDDMVSRDKIFCKNNVGN